MEINNKYKYPIDLETTLLFTIKQGKGDEIEGIVRKITQNIIKQQVSLESVQFICSGIISAVLKALDRMRISGLANGSIDAEICYSGNFETIEEFGNNLILFARRICLYIEGRKQSKNFGLREKILEYVNNNYVNSNISLEIIANKFDISASYITRFFKDQTGYSLMRYIDRLRLDKAKKLLRNTELNLKDIVEQSGYVDRTNFIRKFKKYEGITPIKYRNVTRN